MMSDSIERSSYFYRLIPLVVDLGTETLRDIFYWKVPKSNVVTLFASSEIQSEFMRLKRIKALTEVQFGKVTNNPDPDTYDISLLTTLLTNQKVCGISKPKDGWGKFPDASDISLGADLLRLREIRNEIIAHGSKAQLEVADFKKIWGNVESVLLRLAAHIDASEKDKVKKKIRSAETRVLEPFHDREKKLLQVFIEWQKEDNKKTEVQLSDISNKLENLHLKVDGLKTSADETDAARSNITSEDTLSSIQSQVSSVLKNLYSISRQDDVNPIEANMKRMEDSVKAISELVKILKETVEKSNHSLEELSENAHKSGCQPMSATFERDQGRQYVPDRPKKPKIENPHAMTDKEIFELSKKIGYEWESLRIHLDFTEAQGHALKWAFNDDVQVRTYQMLKRWHDVVVDCGENPKKLLAAAFVNASTNYQMAYSLVSRQQFDANAKAQPATVERIQKIFSRTGFDHGDVVYDRPGSGASYRQAGPPPSSFNVYGGDVRIEGLGIHQPQSSSSSNVASDSLDGSGSRDTSFGSFNIHGGKVALSNMAVGSTTQDIGFPSYNQLPSVKSSSNVSSDSIDWSGSRDTSFGSFNIHGGKVALSNMAVRSATQDIGFPSYNQLPSVKTDEPDAASSKVSWEDILSPIQSTLSSLAGSLSISRPDDINQILADSIGKICLDLLNIGLQQYNKDKVISEWNTQISGKDFGTRQRETVQFSGHLFKKNKDETLSERMVNALSEQMKSVGALITAGRTIGTVFRVGSKYVMTASHVVSMVIDPHTNGNPDIRLLESDETFINFNESLVSSCDVRYKVRKEFIENKMLDVAVLEIADETLSGLPMKMNLCVNDLREVGVTNVSVVGYGHPVNPNKHLDPKCEIIPPLSDRLHEALCYYQYHLDYIRSEIQKKGGNPDVANKGYDGFNQPSKFLLDSFIEHGASGGPALTNDERTVQVVGFLTHGLPEFYFLLPDSIKGSFPKYYCFEVGTKMNYIFEWMKATQVEEIVKDIFMPRH